MSQDSVTGALVSLKDEGNGKWLVKQLSTEVYEDEPLIDWRHGPVRYQGHINSQDFSVNLTNTVAGITAGPITGNLKDGIKTRWNLDTAKGETRLYLRHDEEVWVHIDIKITYNGHYEGDYKIITLD